MDGALLPAGLGESPAREGAERGRMFRSATIVLLVLGYIAISCTFQLGFREGTVYTHFAYIPLVLAGLWWGKRGIVVGLILGALILAFHMLGVASAGLGPDLGRIAFFLLTGSLFGVVGERMEAGREALRHSESRYRRLIEKSLSAVFVYRDERILFSNSRLGHMLGFELEELIGKPIWDLIDAEDRDAVRDRVESRARGEASDLRYEARLVRKDGSMLWSDVASSQTDWDGAPAVLVNLYDITSRKEAERLSREQEDQLVHSTQLAELGEMAAGVAHELAQPLTGIKTFSKNAIYMLEKDAGRNEEVADNLRLISEQVDRAARIIRQMRELAHKSEREFAPVDLNAAVRETVEFFDAELRHAGIEVEVRLQEGFPPVLGDRVQLGQVFLNLLNNAIHAMEETSEKRLGLSTALAPGREGVLVVEVKDTGKGFCDDEVEKLFAPFYSTKKPGQGTGLGLSISRKIIQEHAGSIEASGQPGRGAVFRVLLPAHREEMKTEV